MLLISREAEVARMRSATERLPRAQRDAVAARLAGRRPASPAERQALRAAVSRLRVIMGVPMPV